jgi:hypothetical protein
MKYFTRWLASVSLILLIVVTADMNLNRNKLSVGNQSLLRYLEIAIAAILLALLLWALKRGQKEK